MIEAWNNPYFGGSVLNPLRAKPFGKIAIGKKGGEQDLMKKENEFLEDISKSSPVALMSFRNIKLSKSHYMHLTILLTDKDAPGKLEAHALKNPDLDKSFAPDRTK